MNSINYTQYSSKIIHNKCYEIIQDFILIRNNYYIDKIQITSEIGIIFEIFIKCIIHQLSGHSTPKIFKIYNFITDVINSNIPVPEVRFTKHIILYYNHVKKMKLLLNSISNITTFSNITSTMIVQFLKIIATFVVDNTEITYNVFLNKRNLTNFIRDIEYKIRSKYSEIEQLLYNHDIMKYLSICDNIVEEVISYDDQNDIDIDNNLEPNIIIEIMSNSYKPYKHETYDDIVNSIDERVYDETEENNNIIKKEFILLLHGWNRL